MLLELTRCLVLVLLVPVDVPLDVSTSEVFDLEGYDGYTDSDDQEDEHYHLVTDGMINIKDIAEELVIIENLCVLILNIVIKC